LTTSLRNCTMPKYVSVNRIGDLVSRVAVVTGAASGIGLAVSRHLGHLGHCVAMLDVNGDAAARAADDLRARGVQSLACVRETFRADATGAFRSFKDWWAGAMETLDGAQLFVAAQIDDNLPEILDLLGPDYGHLDIGSDPDGMHVLTHRTDLAPDVARKIVDTNGRRPLGIAPEFRPAPAPTTTALPRDRIALGLP
jgi:NAD(P)-dependent dehydrogenase (short-subunit alcohol dehydrogenase family)